MKSKQHSQIKMENIVQHAITSWHTNKEGRVVIVIDQNHPVQNFFRKTIAKSLPKQQELTLDENNSQIWLLIDGNQSVATIYHQFSASKSDENNDLLARFGSVIDYYYKNGWIKII